MKKNKAKITVVTLAAVILLLGAGTAVYAFTENRSETGKLDPTETVVNAEKNANNKKEDITVTAGSEGILTSALTGTVGESETVYVISGADGTVNKVISDGQDCTGRELPVSIKVGYTLDGQPVSPQEIAGKSGHVVIRYDYRNDEYTDVVIGGKEERINVPYAVLTGMVLENDVFENVTVTNGKLFDDGSRYIAAGIAFPGLSDALGVGSNLIEIPDHFEISADVKNFELNMTLSLVTNDMLDSLNSSELSSLDLPTDQIDVLSKAADQLSDGSKTLYDGLCTLLEKTSALSDGVATLSAGAKDLKDGAKELDEGAGTLKKGAANLESGLSTLASNNETLNNGAKQVFERLLATAQNELAAAGLDIPAMTVDNFGEVLDSVIASLDETNVYAQAQSAVAAAVEANREYITAQVTEGVKAQITAAVMKNFEGMDPELAAGLAEAAVEEKMKTDEIQLMIAQKTDEQIEALIAQNMAGDEVQGKLAAASEGAKKVIGLKASLDNYNTFYLGLKTYTAGVAEAAKGADSLKSGAATLKDGTKALSSGAGDLCTGVGTLEKGVEAFGTGVTQLKDGSKTLADGMNDFNEQGVQKIVSVFDGDVSDLMERVKVLEGVTDTSGDGSEASEKKGVKYIYRTEEIMP